MMAQWIALLIPVNKGPHEGGIERTTISVIEITPALIGDDDSLEPTLLALRRSDNILRICIVTADSKPKAIRKAMHRFDRIKFAAQINNQKISINRLDDSGSMLYRNTLSMIDEAMKLHGGIQKEAAEYLGITTRVLNYHLQCDELIHWCPKVSQKRHQLTKMACK